MEIVQEGVVEIDGGSAEPPSNAVNPVLNPETQVDQPEVKEEKHEEPIPKGVQKRIDRAVRQKYEAEARAKMLEERLSRLEQSQYVPKQQQSKDDSEPTIDKFENFDDYVKAKAEWIAESKINSVLSEREKRAQQEQESRYHREVQHSWAKRIEQATAEMPDFEDVLGSSDVPMSNVMQQAIMESDVGPKLAYYLASNPDEAVKIAQMNPMGAVRTLGRIEERLQSPVRKTTNAPEPLKPVGNRASTSKDPGKMSDAEYAKWRKQGKAA